MQKVLTKDLGAEWKEKFHSFNPQPFAAASIGQVHEATLHDGRMVAVKIQVSVVEVYIGLHSFVERLMSLFVDFGVYMALH